VSVENLDGRAGSNRCDEESFHIWVPSCGLIAAEQAIQLHELIKRARQAKVDNNAPSVASFASE